MFDAPSRGTTPCGVAVMSTYFPVRAFARSISSPSHSQLGTPRLQPRQPSRGAAAPLLAQPHLVQRRTTSRHRVSRFAAGAAASPARDAVHDHSTSAAWPWSVTNSTPRQAQASLRLPTPP